MGKWAELAESIIRRDREHIATITCFTGGGTTVEGRAALADGRAADALGILIEILKYLDEQDTAKEASNG